MNEFKMLAFLRRVVLDSGTDSDIRSEALDLLLEANGVSNTVNINLFGVGHVAIPKSTYQTISELVRNGRKIEAIKALRYWYAEARNNALLGLREAKDTVDNWPTGLA